MKRRCKPLRLQQHGHAGSTKPRPLITIRTMTETETLPDKELGAQATQWRRRALQGDLHARGIAHQLEAELRRRAGALPLTTRRWTCGRSSIGRSSDAGGSPGDPPAARQACTPTRVRRGSELIGRHPRSGCPSPKARHTGPRRCAHRMQMAPRPHVCPRGKCLAGSGIATQSCFPSSWAERWYRRMRERLLCSPTAARIRPHAPMPPRDRSRLRGPSGPGGSRGCPCFPVVHAATARDVRRA